MKTDATSEVTMITIDALGKDGASILPDLNGASPTGGYVRSEARNHAQLACGDVIRDSTGPGEWAVVADIRHNGMLGYSSVGLIRADGSTAVLSMWATDCACVRTDTRIDPDTLYKIARENVTAS